MSIKDASIPVGATISPSGGTATSLVVLGGSLTDTTAYVGTTGVTQLTRTDLTFSGKQPRVSSTAPGGFTQGRSALVIRQPKTLANSARTINSMKIELSIDPETSAAEVTSLKNLAILALLDSDFDNFWLNQATS